MLKAQSDLWRLSRTSRQLCTGAWRAKANPKFRGEGAKNGCGLAWLIESVDGGKLGEWLNYYIHDDQLREYIIYKLYKLQLNCIDLRLLRHSWFLAMRKVFFLSFSKRTNSDMVTCFPGKLVACRCCGRILSWRPLATCGADFFGRVRFGGGLDICFVCLHSRQLARVGARMKDSWNMLKSSRPITVTSNNNDCERPRTLPFLSISGGLITMHKIIQVATKAMTVRNNNSSRLEAWFRGGTQGISKLCQHYSILWNFSDSLCRVPRCWGDG